jgi:hypothetical protein
MYPTLPTFQARDNWPLSISRIHDTESVVFQFGPVGLSRFSQRTRGTQALLSCILLGDVGRLGMRRSAIPTYLNSGADMVACISYRVAQNPA